MGRVLVIVNPIAGRGRASTVWARALSRIGQLPAGVECATTRASGDARRLACEATRSGAERVVAVGGDGTVSEVANGLAGTDVALGVMPAGTGNDFSRALGLPRAPEAALHLALTGAVRRIDLGRVRIGERSSAFVNVAGCGFDAEVVRRTRASAHMGGTLTYLVGIFQTLLTFRPRPMRLVIDGQSLHRRALGVAVAIGPRYGGGMLIAPRAVVDDGLFEVCLIGDVNPAQVLALLPRLYAGTHGRHPAVEFFSCRQLEVDASGVECQADGEPLGALPVALEVRPRELVCVAGQTP